jgi:hypothetical protein
MADPVEVPEDLAPPRSTPAERFDQASRVVGFTAPARPDHHARMRIRAAATRAKIVYPARSASCSTATSWTGRTSGSASAATG